MAARIDGHRRDVRRAHRSRATVTALTAAAPASSSASAAAHSVAPVVTTSSTRMTQRPATARRAPGETANASRTLSARCRRSSRYCASVAWVRTTASTAGRRSSRAATVGDQRRLVVAALAPPSLVDRDRDDDRAADAGDAPACRDRLAERLREAPLPGVLQRMEGPAHDAGERRAPLELEQRLRRALGKPERRPGRQRHAGTDPRQAAGADRRALRTAARTARRQREIQQAPDRGPRGRHGGRASRAPLTRDLRRALSGARPPRPGRPRPSRTRRSSRPAAPARRPRHARAGRARSTPAGCGGRT